MQVDRLYQQVANEYRDANVKAAEAKAAHVKERAKAVLRFKATESERMSQAEAETRAEADDEIASLHLAMLTTAALASSCKEKLVQLKEASTNARAEATHEREIDRLHAEGRAGAA